MNSTRIAVLMTCHDRKDTTIACLHKLMSQESLENVSVQVFLVDDGCTDRTGEAVRNCFPNVKVLKGDGSLFWCGGMRLAFGEALKKDFDYYLWLNDDSMLFSNAIQKLLDTTFSLQRKIGKDVIVAGSMQDAQTKLLTYGGSKRLSYLRPLSFLWVKPSDDPHSCDVVNGNCVLIPRNIAKVTGNLSSDFTHGLGDYYYSLRARSNGFSCWITPGFVGTCSRNSFKGSCKDNALSIRLRANKLSKPTGFPPAKEYMLFIRRHGGILWPIYWLRTYIRMKFPLLWVLLRSKKIEKMREEYKHLLL